MTTLWQTLIGNLAVVALFFSSWLHTRHWLQNAPIRLRSLVFGLCLGGAAIASMALAVQLRPGVYFDLRVAILAISGFFGGPLSGVLTGFVTVAFRLAVGGDGVFAGEVSILLAAVAGTLGFWMVGHDPKAKHVLALGLCVVAINVINMVLLPDSFSDLELARTGPSVAVINFITTLLMGLVLIQLRRGIEERNLLVAALGQAPDFTYVKNLNSEFAAVNEAVAALHGYRRPADMNGKTDFDLAEWGRAQELFVMEQELLKTGESVADFEEFLTDENGVERWYSTSKVPLRNSDGKIIGLTGVTRDVTQDKRLENDLTASRNQLSYALTEMSDGLAMFDHKGYLVFCNDRYRKSFPLTEATRQPGVHIRQILQAVLDTGEQVNAGRDGAQSWLNQVANSLHIEGEEEVHLFDGRWLLLRTRPTEDGSSMVVVSDVTKIKLAELALVDATEQLKLLANTDGLTGLINRRSFDHRLEAEIARSVRHEQPLSVLMIDVDRFKLYNDYYGHPAGDECLRVVARCLTQVLNRPADVVARYGGEEFVVILPDTDEAGAIKVAEDFRTFLHEMAIPHDSSEFARVTASVGISSYGPQDRQRYATELLSMADKALYLAKSGGRDQVTAWRPTMKRGAAGVH